jgi:transcriptional regulator with XRE-family HTH domain
MKPGERIRYFRKNKGLTQKDFANKLGYSDAFLSDIERGKVEPSREFLKKMKEIFGIPSDYILYSDTGEQWEKIERKLIEKGLSEEEIEDIKPHYFSGLLLLGREDYQRGYKHRFMVTESEGKYGTLPTSTKKLLNNVLEILESGNEIITQTLRANIKAFLKVTHAIKKDYENKSKVDG